MTPQDNLLTTRTTSSYRPWVAHKVWQTPSITDTRARACRASRNNTTRVASPGTAQYDACVNTHSSARPASLTDLCYILKMLMHWWHLYPVRQPSCRCSWETRHRSKLKGFGSLPDSYIFCQPTARYLRLGYTNYMLYHPTSTPLIPVICFMWQRTHVDIG